MSRWTSKTTTIVGYDGSGNTITWGPGPMDLELGPYEAGNYEAIETRNNGVHDGHVEGDDLVQDVSITIEQKRETQTSAVSADRFLDFIRKTGVWASRTSIDSTVWCVKLVITMTDGTTTATITLPKVRPRVDSHGWKKEGNSYSIKGKSVTAPVFT